MSYSNRKQGTCGQVRHHVLSITPFPPKLGRCWFWAGSNSGTSSSVFHTNKAGSGSKKQVPSQHQLLGGPETRTGDVGFVPRLWVELPHQKQKYPPPFFFTVNQEDEA